MTGTEVNIHALDSAYRPFPSFAEWASRTSVNTVRWDRNKATIEDCPEMSATALERARNVVKRAAAMDTGAIEGLYEVDRGFTFTVALETAAWEVELAKKGENVRSLFEAQLHAYDYVLDLATKAEPISEVAVRKLHEVVCAAQQTYRVLTPLGFQEQSLPKGRYKVSPNHVFHARDGASHSYAPVDVTPTEMARFVMELRSKEFQTAHPALQAAYAHYSLASIHPFADGNGRVARALASVFTYRAISMPIMILSEHKKAYLDALEAADGGDYQQFVDFMLERVLDTIALVNESFQSGLAPTPEEAAAAFNRLYITRGGYTQGQVDYAGDQLFRLISAELTKIAAAKLGANLRGSAGIRRMLMPQAGPDPPYRLPVRSGRNLNVVHVEFNSSPPAEARIFREYVLWLPRDAASDDDLQLVFVQGGTNKGSFNTKEKSFSARMNELIPAPSGVLQIRVGLFADRLIGEMLVELKSLAENALRGQR